MKNKFFPSTILQIIIFFIIAILIMLFVVKIEEDYFSEVSINYRMIAFLTLSSIPLYLGVLIYNYFNGYKLKQLEIFNIRNLDSLLYIVPLAILVFLGVVQFLYTFFNTKELTYISLNYFYIIIFILLTPICEEIIYRGVVLYGLQKRYNNKKAVIISTLLFMFSHDPHDYFIALVIGGLMGFIFVKTKNIFITILVHIIINLSSALFNNYILFNDSISMPIVLTIHIASFVMLVGFVYIFKNKIFQKSIS